jgi:recombination protein RecA
MEEAERLIAARLAKLSGPPAGRAIRSGCISLDWTLATGGFPRGRLVEIYGPEACGKTTVALSAAAEAQKNSGTAAFIDADHALDGAYAAAVGVDLERLLLAAPACGEEALEIATRLAGSRAVDLVAIDSVAALVPRMELDGGPAGDCPGLQHHLFEHGLRKLAAAAARGDCAVILVNQIRSRMPAASGDPETTAGGYALRLHASIRVELRPLEARPDGLRVRVRATKNKLAEPRQATFEIRHGQGIARDRDLADCAARCGIPAAELSRQATEAAVRRALGMEE